MNSNVVEPETIVFAVHVFSSLERSTIVSWFSLNIVAKQLILNVSLFANLAKIVCNIRRSEFCVEQFA